MHTADMFFIAVQIHFFNELQKAKFSSSTMALLLQQYYLNPGSHPWSTFPRCHMSISLALLHLMHSLADGRVLLKCQLLEVKMNPQNNATWTSKQLESDTLHYGWDQVWHKHWSTLQIFKEHLHIPLNLTSVAWFKTAQFLDNSIACWANLTSLFPNKFDSLTVCTFVATTR